MSGPPRARPHAHNRRGTSLLAPLASHADPARVLRRPLAPHAILDRVRRPGPHDRRAVPIRTRRQHASRCHARAVQRSLHGGDRANVGQPASQLGHASSRSRVFRRGRPCLVSPCAPDQQACCSGSDPHPPRARSRPEDPHQLPVCMDPPSMAARAGSSAWSDPAHQPLAVREVGAPTPAPPLRSAPPRTGPSASPCSPTRS